MTLFYTLGPKLFFLAGALLFAFLLVRGLQKGVLTVAYGITVARDEAPDGFWIVAALNVFFILCLLIGAAVA